jgi:outer membrane protein assembly factor BamA
LASYIGSGDVIELSYELRYTFPYLPFLGEFLAEKLSNSGVTFFADAGNAFNRLTPTRYRTSGILDIIDPRNWAWAVGAGVRYNTSVGPFRVDFGVNVYDPLQIANSRQWIFKRVFLRSIATHISIGHAF